MPGFINQKGEPGSFAAEANAIAAENARREQIRAQQLQHDEELRQRATAIMGQQILNVLVPACNEMLQQQSISTDEHRWLLENLHNNPDARYAYIAAVIADDPVTPRNPYQLQAESQQILRRIVNDYRIDSQQGNANPPMVIRNVIGEVIYKADLSKGTVSKMNMLPPANAATGVPSYGPNGAVYPQAGGPVYYPQNGAQPVPVDQWGRPVYQQYPNQYPANNGWGNPQQPLVYPQAAPTIPGMVDMGAIGGVGQNQQPMVGAPMNTVPMYQQPVPVNTMPQPQVVPQLATGGRKIVPTTVSNRPRNKLSNIIAADRAKSGLPPLAQPQPQVQVAPQTPGQNGARGRDEKGEYVWYNGNKCYITSGLFGGSINPDATTQPQVQAPVTPAPRPQGGTTLGATAEANAFAHRNPQPVAQQPVPATVAPVTGNGGNTAAERARQIFQQVTQSRQAAQANSIYTPTPAPKMRQPRALLRTTHGTPLNRAVRQYQQARYPNVPTSTAATVTREPVSPGADRDPNSAYNRNARAVLNNIVNRRGNAEYAINANNYSSWEEEWNALVAKYPNENPLSLDFQLNHWDEGYLNGIPVRDYKGGSMATREERMFSTIWSPTRHPIPGTVAYKNQQGQATTPDTPEMVGPDSPVAQSAMLRAKRDAEIARLNPTPAPLTPAIEAEVIKMRQDLEEMRNRPHTEEIGVDPDNVFMTQDDIDEGDAANALKHKIIETGVHPDTPIYSVSSIEPDDMLKDKLYKRERQYDIKYVDPDLATEDCVVADLSAPVTGLRAAYAQACAHDPDVGEWNNITVLKYREMVPAHVSYKRASEFMDKCSAAIERTRQEFDNEHRENGWEDDEELVMELRRKAAIAVIGVFEEANCETNYKDNTNFSVHSHMHFIRDRLITNFNRAASVAMLLADEKNPAKILRYMAASLREIKHALMASTNPDECGFAGDPAFVEFLRNGNDNTNLKWRFALDTCLTQSFFAIFTELSDGTSPYMCPENKIHRACILADDRIGLRSSSVLDSRLLDVELEMNDEELSEEDKKELEETRELEKNTINKKLENVFVLLERRTAVIAGSGKKLHDCPLSNFGPYACDPTQPAGRHIKEIMALGFTAGYLVSADEAIEDCQLPVLFGINLNTRITARRTLIA